jgi:uncharacterized protein
MVIAARLGDPQLDAVVAAIVERVQPELVLLFGSRARGDAHEHSDYDLMLVVRDDGDAERCSTSANEICFQLKLPVDILVRKTSEYLRWQNDPGFLDWLVSREARVLYSSGNVPQRSHSDRVHERQQEGLEIWIARADDDFRALLSSLTAADPPLAAICFHAHACIEKLLKALIVTEGTFPPRTHELGELLRRAVPEIRDDPEMIAGCSVLQKVYPKSRYNPNPLPTVDEAQRAVAAARLARERLLKELKRQR